MFVCMLTRIFVLYHMRITLYNVVWGCGGLLEPSVDSEGGAMSQCGQVPLLLLSVHTRS